MTGAAAIPSITVLEVLRDRIVILWPDNDEPGVQHMESIAKALAGIAREIRWLQILGLGPKAGAADVPTADIARLVESYARVMRPRVSTESTSLREKGESPSSSRECLDATYAREVGTKRYSRAELAELRKSVQLRFNAPSDAALSELIDALRAHPGPTRPAPPDQLPDPLLPDPRPGHRPAAHRAVPGAGQTENLLLAAEIEPPAGTRPATKSRPCPPAGSGHARLPTGRAAFSEGWHCASIWAPGTSQRAVPTARSSAARATRGRSDELRPLPRLRRAAAVVVAFGPPDVQLGLSDPAVAVAAGGR